MSPDIWIPLSRVSRAPLFHQMMADVTSATFRVFGRMKQGASVFQAREQMKAVAGQLGSGKSQMTGIAQHRQTNGPVLLGKTMA